MAPRCHQSVRYFQQPVALHVYQFDECVVDRQTIELRAVYRTECFKVLQSIHLFKDGSVTAQRGWGVEAARSRNCSLCDDVHVAQNPYRGILD